jgi:hypothetical protein
LGEAEAGNEFVGGVALPTGVVRGEGLAAVHAEVGVGVGGEGGHLYALS